MSPPTHRIRLVVTIGLGQDGHDATVKQVVAAEDPGSRRLVDMLSSSRKPIDDGGTRRLHGRQKRRRRS